MNPLRSFEEFLGSGTVKRQRADIPRSKSLAEEAEKRKAFLGVMSSKIGISDDNANYYVEAAYDVMMELIRAKMLLDGFNTSGAYAHEAGVAYLRSLGFSEPDVSSANDLRYFRNGINYYGKRMDADYAKKVLRFLDEIYPRLKKLSENKG